MKISVLAMLERRLLNAKTDAERELIAARLREAERENQLAAARETR